MSAVLLRGGRKAVIKAPLIVEYTLFKTNHSPQVFDQQLPLQQRPVRSRANALGQITRSWHLDELRERETSFERAIGLLG
jgi:hypothetical protein